MLITSTKKYILVWNPTTKDVLVNSEVNGVISTPDINKYFESDDKEAITAKIESESLIERKSKRETLKNK